MKTLFLFTSLFLLPRAQAAVLGTPMNCPEKIQVEANEGDTFVSVTREGKTHKLLSTSGAPFSLQSKKSVTFSSDDKNNKLGDASLEFEMPAMVSAQMPRLTVTLSGVQHKCAVEIHERKSK